jgi:PIN domain nuclease of toxin-antitoxin system
VKLLLDTHALLWWLADDQRLGPAARDLIEDPGNDVLVSIVSLWEIVVKVRVGKLHADIGAIANAIRRQGFIMLEISTPHLLGLAALPIHHRDPFDHLLIAQAVAEQATLMSDDRHTAQYPVQSVPCRD